MEINRRLTTTPPARPVRSRLATGFTLVELLVVITIMGILAGVLAMTLSSALSDAKISRARTEVATIGQMLQARVNEVSLAQLALIDVRIDGGIDGGPVASAPAPGGMGTSSFAQFNANERARVMMMARRDMLRMVLPQCRADLLYPPARLQYRSLSGAGVTASAVQLKPPAQWVRMRSKAGLISGEQLNAFDATVEGIEFAFNETTGQFVFPYGAFNSADNIYDDPSDPLDRVWTRENESAECLYLILATTDLQGELAIDYIPSDRIADSDGDGFLEVLDPWEQAYFFLREPTGLRSPAINNFDTNAPAGIKQYPADPDPLDFLLTDFRYDDNFLYIGLPPTTALFFFTTLR